MTITATSRTTSVKARPVGFREEDHPRDRLGRFIETGAEVRVWGGFLGKVIRTVGGGRIEVERNDNQQHVIVHRNYLTVVARPDGSAPTKDESSAGAIDKGQADADATEVDTADAVVDLPDLSAEAQLLDSWPADDFQLGDIATALDQYEEAVNNGIDGDEADERARLLAALDDFEGSDLGRTAREEATTNPDTEEGRLGAALARIRQAAAAEPDQSLPGMGRRSTPGGRRLVRDGQFAPDESRTVNGQQVTIGQRASGSGGKHEGTVVGFTDRGGIIIRDADGNDWPYLPDSEVTVTPTGRQQRAQAAEQRRDGADPAAENTIAVPDLKAGDRVKMPIRGETDTVEVLSVTDVNAQSREARVRDSFGDEHTIPLLNNGAYERVDAPQGDQGDQGDQAGDQPAPEAPATPTPPADAPAPPAAGGDPEIGTPEAPARVLYSDLQPGDQIINTPDGTTVTVVDLTTDRGRARQQPGASARPDAQGYVAVDDEGRIVRARSTSPGATARRVGRVDPPAMPERQTETIKADDLRPGDRIDLPNQGEVVVSDILRGQGNAGTTSMVSYRRTPDAPIQTRSFTPRENVTRTGTDQPHTPAAPDAVTQRILDSIRGTSGVDGFGREPERRVRADVHNALIRGAGDDHTDVSVGGERYRVFLPEGTVAAFDGDTPPERPAPDVPDAPTPDAPAQDAPPAPDAPEAPPADAPIPDAPQTPEQPARPAGDLPPADPTQVPDVVSEYDLATGKYTYTVRDRSTGDTIAEGTIDAAFNADRRETLARVRQAGIAARDAHLREQGLSTPEVPFPATITSDSLRRWFATGDFNFRSVTNAEFIRDTLAQDQTIVPSRGGHLFMRQTGRGQYSIGDPHTALGFGALNPDGGGRPSAKRLLDRYDRELTDAGWDWSRPMDEQLRDFRTPDGETFAQLLGRVKGEFDASEGRATIINRDYNAVRLNPNRPQLDDQKRYVDQLAAGDKITTPTGEQLTVESIEPMGETGRYRVRFAEDDQPSVLARNDVVTLTEPAAPEPEQPTVPDAPPTPPTPAVTNETQIANRDLAAGDRIRLGGRDVTVDRIGRDQIVDGLLAGGNLMIYATDSDGVTMQREVGPDGVVQRASAPSPQTPDAPDTPDTPATPDTGSRPGAPEPADGSFTGSVPTMRNTAAAATFIAAQAGITDQRAVRALAAALSPTVRRIDGMYPADGMNYLRGLNNSRLNGYLTAAWAGHAYNPATGRAAWDGAAARAGLERYLSGDVTMPAGSVGQRATISVLDENAPIRIGRPAAQRDVTGQVINVTPYMNNTVMVVIRDDNGEFHSTSLPASDTLRVEGADARPETPEAPEVTQTPDTPTARTQVTQDAIDRLRRNATGETNEVRFPADVDRDLAVTAAADPMTTSTADGTFLVYRSAEGDQQWRIATAGGFIRLPGGNGTRERALAVAEVLAAARDRDGNPFPTGPERDVSQAAVRTWRDAQGRSFADVFRQANATHPDQPTNDADWVNPPQRLSALGTNPAETDRVLDAYREGTASTEVVSGAGEEAQSERRREMAIVAADSDHTIVSQSGRFVIHRNIEGEREWTIATVNGMRALPVGTVYNRAEALAITRELDRLVDEADRGRGDDEKLRVNLDDGDTTNGLSWRSPENKNLAALARQARATVPQGAIVNSEWARPIDTNHDDPQLAGGGDDAGGNAISLDPRTANPSAFQRAMLATFTYEHPESGYRTELRYFPSSEGGRVAGPIRDRNGNRVGRVERSVFINSAGEIEVHHDFLKIEPEFQGGGFADAYYKHLYEQYEQRGIEAVTIQANIDVGGYAWAQRGFDWDGGTMPGYQRNAIISNLSATIRATGRNSRRTPEERERIEQFIGRLRDGEDFTPQQVANALSDIRWDHQLPSGRTVPMWPGKFAMLGTNWHGKFYVNPAGRQDPADPDAAGKVPDLTSRFDDTDTVQTLNGDRDRLIRFMDARRAALGPDKVHADEGYADAEELIEAINLAREDAFDRALTTEFGAPNAPIRRFGSLEAGDRFVRQSENTDEPVALEYVGINDQGQHIANGPLYSQVVLDDVSDYERVWLLPVNTDTIAQPGDQLLTGDNDTRRRAALATFSFAHDESGLRTDDYNVNVSEGNVSFSAMIRDRNGNDVGRVRREVSIDADGNVNVYHALLSLNSDEQGGGFADAYYKHLDSQYRERGVNVVTITANLDVGGYAWAQRGFGWDSGRLPTSARGSIVNKLNDLRRGRDSDFKPNDAQKAAIDALAARIQGGEDLTPQQVANALSDVRWERRLPSGAVVPMWPGKYAMLGLTWAGRRQVGPSRRSDRFTVSTRPVAEMDLPDLLSEEALLTDLVRGWTAGQDFSPNATNAALRLAEVRIEADRRHLAAADVALGGNSEAVQVSQLNEGDYFAVPFAARTPGGDGTPELVTLVSSRPYMANDRQVGIIATVRTGDGSTRDITLYQGLNTRRSTVAEPRLNVVPASRINEGDVVATTDFDGVPILATVTSIEKGEDGRLIVTMLFPNGQLVDNDMAGDDLATIVTNAGNMVPAEVQWDERPEPGDLLDADIDAEIEQLTGRYLTAALAGDQQGDYFQRATRRVAALRAEQARRTADAYVGVEEHPAGTPTSRPTLYTYQRKNLLALNLDAADSTAPAGIQQAAARLRARKPLSAAENAAMRDYLRQLADDPATGVRRQRMYGRLAHAFDAANAHALGRQAPPPADETLTRTTPAGLIEGDTVVLAGEAKSYTVAGVRKLMSGRLYELTLTDEDGNTTSRYVARDQAAYSLPAPPPPEPVAPPEEREYVLPDDLNAGDVVLAIVDGQVEQRTVAGVRANEYGVPIVDYTDGTSSATLRNHGIVTRVTRGPDSQAQGPRIPAPVDGDPVSVDVTALNVGDRVTIERPYRAIGMILEIKDFTDEDSFLAGRQLLVLSDDGDVRQVPIRLDTAVTRTSDGNGNVAVSVAAERQRARMVVRRNAITSEIESSHVQAFMDLATQLSLAAGQGREYVLGQIAGARFENRRDRVVADLSDLVQGSVPDPEAFATETARQITAAVNDSVRNALRGAIEGAEPLDGETEGQMLSRILGMYINNPPRRHMRNVTRTLLDGRPEITNATDVPEVDVPDDADLAERMAAYRRQVGRFGHGEFRTARYAAIDLDALDRGEAPELTYTTGTERRPDASDGGPSAEDAAQLGVVQAAGRDLLARINQRQDELLGDLLDINASEDNPQAAQLTDAERADIPAFLASYDETLAAAKARFDGLVNQRFGDPRPTGDDLGTLLTQIEEARKERDRLVRIGTRIKRARGQARRDAVYETLSQVRDLGGKRLSWNVGARTTSANRERHERIITAVNQAEDVLPTDWLESIEGYVRTVPGHGNGDIDVSVGNRGGAGHQGNIILSDRSYEDRTLNGNGMTSVAVHELTHFAERAVPGLREAERAFWWKRASTGEVGARNVERLRRGTEDHGDSRQYIAFDDFRQPYTGVNYYESQRRSRANYGAQSESSSSWEIMTTGVEAIFAGADYADGDEDFQSFVLGALALLGDPKPPRTDHTPIPSIGHTRSAETGRRSTGGNGTPRRTTPRRTTRDVTPDVRLHTGADAPFRTGFAGLTAAQQKKLREFEHSFNGYEMKLNEGTVSVFRDSTSMVMPVTNADGAEMGNVRVDISYAKSGAITATVRAFPTRVPAADREAVIENYYEHLSKMFDQLAVTEVQIGSGTGMSPAMRARLGFTWKSGKPAQTERRSILSAAMRVERYARAAVAEAPAGSSERAEAEARLTAVQEVLGKLNDMARGTVPWPSPAELSQLGAGLVPLNAFGSTYASIGDAALSQASWKGKRSTGIRRQRPAA